MAVPFLGTIFRPRRSGSLVAGAIMRKGEALKEVRLLAGYGSVLLAVAIALVIVVPLNAHPGDRYLVSTVWLPATIAAALIATGGIFTFVAWRRQRQTIGAAGVLRQVRTLVWAGVAAAAVALLLAWRAAVEQTAGAGATLATITCCVLIGAVLAATIGRTRR
jgi:hypothetical protein